MVALSRVHASPCEELDRERAAVPYDTTPITTKNRTVFEDAMIARFWNPVTAVGRAARYAVVMQQAPIIAYIDDYKLLMIATLVVILLIVVFRRAAAEDAADQSGVTE
jgi:MFS transporter, DHA2 family, multidrug resistance protein